MSFFIARDQEFLVLKYETPSLGRIYFLYKKVIYCMAVFAAMQ